MTRTRVRWGRVAALLAAVVMSVGTLASRAGAGAERRAPQRVYVVRPGETVWDVAERLAGTGKDPRPLVDRLVAANHLHNAVVRPGQPLVVPAA